MGFSGIWFRYLAACCGVVHSQISNSKSQPYLGRTHALPGGIFLPLCGRGKMLNGRRRVETPPYNTLSQRDAIPLPPPCAGEDTGGGDARVAGERGEEEMKATSGLNVQRATLNVCSPSVGGINEPRTPNHEQRTTNNEQRPSPAGNLPCRGEIRLVTYQMIY